MKDYKQILADNVRRAMESAGLNKAALSRLAGISRPTLDRVLSGEHFTDFETIQTIAAALNTEVQYLAQGDQPSLPQDVHLHDEDQTIIEAVVDAARSRNKVVADLRAEIARLRDELTQARSPKPRDARHIISHESDGYTLAVDIADAQAAGREHEIAVRDSRKLKVVKDPAPPELHDQLDQLDAADRSAIKRTIAKMLAKRKSKTASETG